MKRALTALALLLFAGCASFDAQQSFLFTDEEGNVIVADYGNLKKKRKSTFLAPNGREMEMFSDRVVRVTLPDGDVFTAYECMNTLPIGTMYRSANEKWMYHAAGMTCKVFHSCVNPLGQPDYEVVFDGMICEGPKKD